MSEKVTRTKIEQSVLAEIGKIYNRIGQGKSRRDDKVLHDVLLNADVASRNHQSMDPLVRVLNSMCASPIYDVSSFGKRLWAILMEDTTDPIGGEGGRTAAAR